MLRESSVGEKTPSGRAFPDAPPRDAERRRAGRQSHKIARRQLRLGLLFISPWLVGFAAFTVYPFLATLYYSFTRFTGVGSPHFIGLANYRQLFSDGLFGTSLWNTFYYTIIEVPFSTVVGILIAMLLNMKVKGLSVYRTIFYLPVVVPLVASSMLWLWLFNPQYGIVNSLLSDVHIPGPDWMFSTAWSKPTFILLGLWGTGVPIVIYLAALQGVPKYMYEAASLDGAGAVRRFRHVTLPMISPAILFNVVIGLVASLQYFTQAFVMTQGGPDNSTLFYSLYIYNQAFQYLHLGYASAMAWLLFVVVVAITILLFKFSSRWVYYAAGR